MFDKIKSLLAEQLNIEESKITLESKIIEDLGADSIDTVELLMKLEDEYGIIVEEEKATSIVTVGDIVNLIEGK